jgi:hypothetical protein
MPRGIDDSSSRTATREENPHSVRPFPNEDVFFFAKRIDNSRVVRQADPRTRRACWRLIGTSIAGAILMIAVLLPVLYGKFCGYKIEQLRQEKARLLDEQRLLVVQENQILSPEHLQELAAQQSFVDPGPERIVYLDGKKEAKEARQSPQGVLPESSEAKPAIE